VIVPAARKLHAPPGGILGLLGRPIGLGRKAYMSNRFPSSVIALNWGARFVILILLLKS
jgi:hypothetical protein